MNDAKYIGLDVHQATISVVVLDSTGHLVMESIIETKAATCKRRSENRPRHAVRAGDAAEEK